MGDKEWHPDNVLDLLGDPLAREALVATNGRPKSAEALAEEFDVSLPTVYRRTNRLIDHGLMTEHLRIDDRKNQFKVFEATVSGVVIDVDERGYEIEVRTDSDVGAQFDAFRSDFGSPASEGNVDPEGAEARVTDGDRATDASWYADPS